MRITTCKDCPDRYLGCHDHCDRYQAEKAKSDKEREEWVKKNYGEYQLIAIKTQKKARRLRKYGDKAW